MKPRWRYGWSMLIGTASCAGPAAVPETRPEAYHVAPPPWSRPDTWAPIAAAETKSAPVGETTVLEELDAARKRLAELEQTIARLRGEGEGLQRSIELLQKDNASLQQFVDQCQTERDVARRELTARDERLKQGDEQMIALMADLLAERIQRVRVERELVLAKIAEAEQREADG